MTNVLLSLGVIGAVLFVVTFIIDGATRPGYRPAYHVVSALALGSRGWIQTTNFIVVGSMMTLAAIGSFSALSGWIGQVLFVVYGVALLASGLFSMDPIRGYPPGTPEGTPETSSRTNDIHNSLGGLVFLSITATAAAFAFQLSETPWVVYSAVTAVAVLVLIGAFGRAWNADSPRSGLIQKVMIVVGWTWVALICVHLMDA